MTNSAKYPFTQVSPIEVKYSGYSISMDGFRTQHDTLKSIRKMGFQHMLNGIRKRQSWNE